MGMCIKQLCDYFSIDRTEKHLLQIEQQIQNGFGANYGRFFYRRVDRWGDLTNTEMQMKFHLARCCFFVSSFVFGVAVLTAMVAWNLFTGIVLFGTAAIWLKSYRVRRGFIKDFEDQKISELLFTAPIPNYEPHTQHQQAMFQQRQQLYASGNFDARFQKKFVESQATQR